MGLRSGARVGGSHSRGLRSGARVGGSTLRGLRSGARVGGSHSMGLRSGARVGGRTLRGLRSGVRVGGSTLGDLHTNVQVIHASGTSCPTSQSCHFYNVLISRLCAVLNTSPRSYQSKQSTSIVNVQIHTYVYLHI